MTMNFNIITLYSKLGYTYALSLYT